MQTALTDGTQAGTIYATPTLAVAPKPSVTPVPIGAGQPLTGLDTTARIPDSTPTTTPKATTAALAAPAPTPAPVTPGYVVNVPDGKGGFYSGPASGAPSQTPPPSTTTAASTTTTGTPPTGMSQADYDAFKKENPTIEPTSQDITRNQLAQAQQDFQDQAKKASDAITNIQNGTTPLTPAEQAQIDGLKAQFEQLIEQQKLTNTGAAGIANVRGYQTGAAEYDPTFQVKTIGSIVTAGMNKITDLQTKEASAIASLTQAFKTADIAAVKDAYSIYKDASEKRTDALQKVIDDTNKAIKDANDARIAADKVVYDTVTKPIQDMGAEAAKYGAPQDVIDAINSSPDVGSAMAAGAGYFQDPTSPAGQYAAYVKDTQAKGLTPMTPGDFLAKQKSSEAYSTAYAQAKAKADVNNILGLDANGTPLPSGDVTGNDRSILGVTGLSNWAFLLATQGPSALTRLSADEKTKIGNEWRNYQIAHGIDGATFQQQYKALGATVQANVLRNNQATTAEAELDATIKNLKSAADDSSFGSMRWSNIAKLFAGQEFNDPNVSRYAMHLNQLRTELAMYNAALSGQIDENGNIRAINPSDQAVADSILKTGLAKGGIQGFEDAVTASRAKMAEVLKQTIDSQNKQVWNMFGVGDKYQGPPVDPKTSVDNYVSANPSKAETVAKLYELPGWDDAKVLEYLNLNPK